MENKEVLREAVSIAGARDIQVDKVAGTIRGVKLHGSESKNGRVYGPRAMEDLKKLYNKLPLRLGHDTTKFVDTVGSVQTVHDKVDGAIYGDITLLQRHHAYETIMEAAESQPHLLKISHEVPNRKYEAERMEDGRLRVNRVYKVDCLAIVTDGGVNESLFEENVSDAEDDDMEVKTAKELKEKYPALYEEVAKEVTSVAEENERLVEALQQRDQASASVKELELKLAKIEEANALATKRQRIQTKAGELKAVLPEDLFEALLNLDDEKVDRILASQPKLTEEGTTTPPPTPEQRSGLAGAKQAFTYGHSFNRLSKYITRPN